MRIELIATDRQSVMLAITPTNRLKRPRCISRGTLIPPSASDILYKKPGRVATGLYLIIVRCLCIDTIWSFMNIIIIDTYGHNTPLLHRIPLVIE